jgi:membrane protease YdiL (CAAX protease family)
VAKSTGDAGREDARPNDEPGGYFHWSRDAAVGLFSVLPLWLVYELLRRLCAPDDRNGAESMLIQGLARFGDRGHLVATACFAVLVFAAARSLVRRRVPWLRVSAVIALEGTVYALMLGPLASALAVPALRASVSAPEQSSLLVDLVGSLGAGIFEELVFRLGLMSALVWIALRAVRAWSLPRWVAGGFAIVVSALVFSWFHHLCGQPYERSVFLFRTMAGVLLGLLMWVRGYGVCVYTHAIYDVHYYLATHGP